MAKYNKKNSIIVDADYAQELINKIERSILERNLDLYISVYNVRGTGKKRIVVSR